MKINDILKEMVDELTQYNAIDLPMWNQRI